MRLGLAEGVVAESVVNEPCYVVMPKRHRLAAAPFVALKDIGDEPMISMPSDSGLRRTLDMAANDRGVVFNHSIITNQFGSLFDFVGRGLGVAIVPASALPPGERIRRLRSSRCGPAITRRIGILRLADKTLMPASQAFLEIFQPKFLAAARGGHSRSRVARLTYKYPAPAPAANFAGSPSQTMRACSST